MAIKVFWVPAETKYTIIVSMVSCLYSPLIDQLQQPITQSSFGEDPKQSIAYDWFEHATAAQQQSRRTPTNREREAERVRLFDNESSMRRGRTFSVTDSAV